MVEAALFRYYNRLLVVHFPHTEVSRTSLHQHFPTVNVFLVSSSSVVASVVEVLRTRHLILGHHYYCYWIQMKTNHPFLQAHQVHEK